MGIIHLGKQSAPHPGNGETDSTRVYKFVVISSDDRLDFVYGPLSEYAYHAGLVKKYCELENIPSGWVKKPDVYEIYGAGHKIRGGGWMEQNPLKKHARLYGYSSAYGAFEPKDIPNLFTQGTLFADYEIEIDD